MQSFKEKWIFIVQKVDGIGSTYQIWKELICKDKKTETKKGWLNKDCLGDYWRTYDGEIWALPLSHYCPFSKSTR